MICGEQEEWIRSRSYRVCDRSMADNLNGLRVGQFEAAQLFEPFVEEALDAQIGHVWHPASSRGRTTYTAFLAMRERLRVDRERVCLMVTAIFRSRQWTNAGPAQEIAAAIASYSQRALSRYQSPLVWGSDPVFSEDGLIAGEVSPLGRVHSPTRFL